LRFSASCGSASDGPFAATIAQLDADEGRFVRPPCAGTSGDPSATGPGVADAWPQGNHLVRRSTRRSGRGVPRNTFGRTADRGSRDMDSLQLNWLDYTIIVVVVVSTVSGAIRGLIKEVLPIVSLIIGLLLAYRISPELQPYVLDWLKNETAAYVFAFLAVFLASWILFGLLGGLLTKLAKATAAGPLDKLFGGILGILRGVAVAVILVIALLAFLPEDSPALSESSLAGPTLSVGKLAIALMPEDIKQDLRDRYEDFKDKAEEKARDAMRRPHRESI